MKNVGLIGLGNIGAFFCRNFIKNNIKLSVFDNDSVKMEAAAELGATTVLNPGEVTLHSDIVFLSLPGSGAVEEVMEGEKGILSVLKDNQLIVDTGTTHPQTDIKYEAICRERGAGFLDAPITWREEGLILMAGGQYEQYEIAKPYLDLVSYKHKYIGSSGQGQILKLMNQMVLANQWAAWAEAIEFGKVNDIDPYLLKDFLEFQIPEDLYADGFKGSGQLSLHYKDLGYLLELAHDKEAHIPVSSLVHEVFKVVKRYGDQDWKQTAIITHWRKMNKKI